MTCAWRRRFHLMWVYFLGEGGLAIRCLFKGVRVRQHFILERGGSLVCCPVVILLLRLRGSGDVTVTNVCLRVPFYGAHYVCYSFCSAAHDRLVAHCVRTLYGRLRVGGRCLGRRGVRAICFNNNAPSRLKRRSFRRVFGTVRGRCKLRSYQRVALRTGPSSLSGRCLRVLSTLPFGHVDVKVRAFSSTALGLLGHHRGTQATARTIHEYQRTNCRGVDVSLVCKLPKRAGRQ